MLWLSLPLHGAECLMPGVPEKQSGAEKAAVSWMTCGAGPWEALPRCPPQDGAETPVRWPHQDSTPAAYCKVEKRETKAGGCGRCTWQVRKAGRL